MSFRSVVFGTSALILNFVIIDLAASQTDRLSDIDRLLISGEVKSVVNILDEISPAAVKSLKYNYQKTFETDLEWELFGYNDPLERMIEKNFSKVRFEYIQNPVKNRYELDQHDQDKVWLALNGPEALFDAKAIHKILQLKRPEERRKNLVRILGRLSYQKRDLVAYVYKNLYGSDFENDWKSGFQVSTKKLNQESESLAVVLSTRGYSWAEFCSLMRILEDKPVQFFSTDGMPPMPDDLSMLSVKHASQLGLAAETSCSPYHQDVKKWLAQISRLRPLKYFKAKEYKAIYILGGFGVPADLGHGNQIEVALKKAIKESKSILISGLGSQALMVGEKPIGQRRKVLGWPQFVVRKLYEVGLFPPYLLRSDFDFYLHRSKLTFRQVFLAGVNPEYVLIDDSSNPHIYSAATFKGVPIIMDRFQKKFIASKITNEAI